MVEWLGTATGLTGVYLSIREKTLAWPFFILCYGLYAYLSFSASFYAAMFLNICFIPISVYGWYQWTRVSKEGSSERVSISWMRRSQLIYVLCIAVLGTFSIGLFLSLYAGGRMPYLDSFATTLSFLAQWALGRKFIENWISWLIADIAFIVLWGIQGYWLSVVMFIVFTAMAALGFASWKKELVKD
ncbi:MAG: nicotinamide riboside transporter PnuC [Verrucomicrobiota bacterium]